MADVTWALLSLPNPADLQGEIGEGSLLRTAYTSAQIQSAATTAKGELLDYLQSHLTDLFVAKNGEYARFEPSVLREFGYSYDDLDTMFDKIGNPDKLRKSAVAKQVEILWTWYSQDDRTELKMNLEYATAQIAIWQKKFKIRIELATSPKGGSIWFDLDGTGNVTDQERVRTKSNFVRV
jgi:hypothetical protein